MDIDIEEKKEEKMKMLTYNNILKKEKLKYTIIISIFLLLTLSIQILIPFTNSIKLTFKILGIAFTSIIIIILIILLLLINIKIKTINIEYNENNIIYYSKNKRIEINYNDIKEIKLASNYLFGQYIKMNNDLSPIYYISDGSNKIYIIILHSDYSKIKNKLLREGINNLYSNTITHKNFNRKALNNKIKFIKFI